MPLRSRCTRWRTWPVSPWCLALVGCLAACRAQPPASIKPTYDPKTGKLEKLEWDRNNDGRVDAWARMDGARLLKIDVDTNGDGTPERWEYYDGTTTMLRAEEDGDGDGTVDRWETWEGDHLTVVAVDTAHLGRPDRRVVYRADGTERVEVDPDGDGTFTVAASRPVRR